MTGHADGEEDPEAKRRRILQETRDIDADEDDDDDDSGDDDDDDDDSDDDSDDEDAELARQLAKSKRERAEKRQAEEAERAAAEQEAKERDIALGNPLLNKQDFNMKRRWNDDVVFKNQARGTDEKGKKKEFVNVSGTLPPRPHGAGGCRRTARLTQCRTCCDPTSTSVSWASTCDRVEAVLGSERYPDLGGRLASGCRHRWQPVRWFHR